MRRNGTVAVAARCPRRWHCLMDHRAFGPRTAALAVAAVVYGPLGYCLLA